MARTRNLNVTVGADVKPFQRAIDQADRSMDKFSKQTTVRGRITGAGIKGIGVAATGATAGIAGLTAGAGYLVKQYEDSAKVGRQTNAVLKSTGGAAGITAKHVSDLATAISRKSGMDDEAIQSAENVLLTFTKVRNETGKGNKVFDDATKTIADMSAALGQDLQSSTIQVGKALNDPIKGITALQRVGVSFTKQQKDQITTLVNSGKTLDAQKIILRELNKEFGGSAAAAATPFDKLKVSVGNLAETAGGALAPMVEKGAAALNRFIIQAQDGTGAGGRFVARVKDIIAGFSSMVPRVRSAIEAVKTGFNTAETAVRGFVTTNRQAIQNVIAAFRAVGDFILDTFKRALPGVRQILQGLQRIVAGAVDVIAGVLTGDFGRAWDGVKGIFRGAVKSLGGIIRAGTAPVREGFVRMFSGVKGVVSGIFDGVVGIFTGAVNKVIGVMNGAIGLFNKLPGPDIGKIGKLSTVGDTTSNANAYARNKRAGGGRIPGQRIAADTVPALLSPQEFVVTGDGERTLESMTFPGVLDWLQGVQAPHFASGGRVAQAARKAGFRGSSLVTALAVARAESGFDERAISPTNDYGVWQINRTYHPSYFAQPNKIFDPDYNARAAYAISSHGSNWRPWTTFRNGDYRKYVDTARSLATSSRGATGGGGEAGTRTVAGAGTGFLGSQYFTGFQAGLEGTSIRPVLGTALEYVGEPQQVSTGSSSSGGSSSRSRVVRGRRSGHFTPRAKWNPSGKPIANWIVPILQQASADGVNFIVSSGYRSRAEQQVLWDRLGHDRAVVAMPGTSNHEGDTYPRGAIDVTGATQGNLTAWLARNPGSGLKHYSNPRDPYHFSAKGNRRGGRIGRRMRAGGWPASARRAYRRAMGKTGGGASKIPGLIDRIATGSQSQIRAALRTAQTIMADRGSFGSIRAWINAANRRAERRGVSAVGIRGLRAFAALAQAEYGRQLGQGVAGVDASESDFDQQDTNLQNQQILAGATDTQATQAQIALDTQQLGTMQANRDRLAALLRRARKGGDHKTVAALQQRLTAQDNQILATRAGIATAQRSLASAAGDGSDGGETDAQRAQREATEALTAAMKEHTDALTNVQSELKRQNDIAGQVQNSSEFQLRQALLDAITGGMGARIGARTFGPGRGVEVAY